MRSLPVVVALAAALVLPGIASAADTGPAVGRGLAWLGSIQQADGCAGSFASTAWVVVAFAAAGIDPHVVQNAVTGASLVDCLRANDFQVFAPNAPLTDVERQTLAIAAAREDARTFAGRDHVARILQGFDGTQFGHRFLLNDDYFALLALRAARYNGPEIAQARQWILLNQHPAGGWSWTVPDPDNAFSAFALAPDTDDTAAAIQALALTDPPGGDPLSTLAQQRGLLFIKSNQYLDGGCTGGVLDVAFQAAFSQAVGSNVFSTSWATMAVTATGQDPDSPAWSHPLTGQSLIAWIVGAQLPLGAWPDFQGPHPQATAFAIIALTGNTFVV